MKLVADPWLLELGLAGDQEKAVAGVLLEAQLRIAARLEHDLDFSREYVKKAIAKAAKRGAVPRCYMRCSRCGVEQTVQGWLEVSSILGKRRFIGLPAKASDPGSLGPALLHCTGNQKALDAVELLDVDIS